MYDNNKGFHGYIDILSSFPSLISSTVMLVNDKLSSNNLLARMLNFPLNDFNPISAKADLAFLFHPCILPIF